MPAVGRLDQAVVLRTVRPVSGGVGTTERQRFCPTRWTPATPSVARVGRPTYSTGQPSNHEPDQRSAEEGGRCEEEPGERPGRYGVLVILGMSHLPCRARGGRLTSVPDSHGTRSLRSPLRVSDSPLGGSSPLTEDAASDGPTGHGVEFGRCRPPFAIGPRGSSAGSGWARSSALITASSRTTREAPDESHNDDEQT